MNSWHFYRNLSLQRNPFGKLKHVLTRASMLNVSFQDALLVHYRQLEVVS